MIKYAIAFGIGFCGGFIIGQADAQTTQPAEYTLKLTAPEVDLIGRGLGTQPFSEVAPLIQKLRSQVVEQQQPKPEPKPTVDPEKPVTVPDPAKP